MGDFFQAVAANMMHRIRMEYTKESGDKSNFLTPQDSRVEVVIERDGGIEHAIDTFRSFLIAMGFSHETIEKEVLKGDDE